MPIRRVGWEAVAARQHGAITWRQLRDDGLGAEAIAGLCARGDLVRTGQHGVYRRGLTPASLLSDCWVARLGVGADAVAVRTTAGRLWELDGVPHGPVQLAVTATRSGRRPGVVRVSHLPAAHRTVVHGIAATTAARTIVDLAAVTDAGQAERALESALRKRLTTIDEIVAVMRIGRPRGAPALRALLALRPEAAAPTESDLETRFLQVARAAGLEEPVRQFRLLASGRPLRLDFAWPAIKLAVETDGATIHGPEAFGPDLRRQNRVVLDGWLIVRFTWEDVVRYPDQTVSTLRRAWRRASLLAPV